MASKHIALIAIVITLLIIFLIVGSSESATSAVYDNAKRISVYCDDACVMYVLKHNGKVYKSTLNGPYVVENSVEEVTLDQYNAFLTDRMRAVPIREEK